MKATIDASMSAARFVHHVDVVGRQRARRQSARLRGRAIRRTPSASSTTEATPVSSETSRACRTPTPNSANDTYSSPVKTGAMYIGFQASCVHASEQRPVARVVHPRAFVVPDDADRRIPWRIGGGKRQAQGERRERDEQQRTPAKRRTPRGGERSRCDPPSQPDVEAVGAGRLHVVGAQPARERRRAHEERRRVVDVGRPVASLQRDHGRTSTLEIGEQALGAVAGPAVVEADDDRPAPEEPRRARALGVDVGRAGEAEDDTRDRSAGCARRRYFAELSPRRAPSTCGRRRSARDRPRATSRRARNGRRRSSARRAWGTGSPARRDDHDERHRPRR